MFMVATFHCVEYFLISFVRFEHPQTGEHLRFSQVPPLDFVETLNQLRNIVN